MEKWKNGKMEKWKNGKMEKWTFSTRCENIPTFSTSVCLLLPTLPGL
jgi:hypothetical protein